jgi:hypothetical protein
VPHDRMPQLSASEAPDPRDIISERPGDFRRFARAPRPLSGVRNGNYKHGRYTAEEAGRWRRAGSRRRSAETPSPCGGPCRQFGPSQVPIT